MNHARIPIAQTHLENAANQTQRFDVIDLHCDALLWGARDFTKTTMHPIFKRRPVGAVDIPRLLRGDVRLQIFAVCFS